MTKNKTNIKKRRRAILLSLILAFAFACPFVASYSDKKASATSISNDTYTCVLPSLYVPASLYSSYSYFYFMPLYLGTENNNMVLWYPRSGDGHISYYARVITPFSLDILSYDVHGLVGALKKTSNETIFANISSSSSAPVRVTYSLPNFDILDYSPNDGLFFNQLSTLATNIRVTYSLDTANNYTRLSYTFLNVNSVVLWEITLTYIKPLASSLTVTQNSTPTFLTSTVNLNAYAEELVSLASRTAFEEGRAVGRQEGLAANENYTFNNLISAVINSPINAVKSIFDFEFLGVNLTSFILSLLTVLVVIKVVGMLI